MIPVLLAYLVFRSCTMDETPGERISYSRFRDLVAADKVAAITVEGEEIRGELKSPRQPQGGEGGEPFEEFYTYFPAYGDESLPDLLREHNVEVDAKPSEDISWLLILTNALPFLLLIGFGVFFLSRLQSQGRQMTAFGRSRAKPYRRQDEETTFGDVAGAEGAKTELKEIIAFLRHPEHFRKLGGLAPKGVLLVGPPGSGKTLLARATAGEAEVPFFNITGSDFMEMFVGVGASRVRNLFRDALRTAPSIIFIDELDSIGRRRGAGLGGGHDEREQTLNQLLSEMDGFEAKQGVIVMAATNRPDILDPALLRPGRFDRRIQVEPAGVKARRQILEIHAQKKKLAEDVDLEELARRTPGFSGADLANLLNEAALLAVREEKDEIGSDDIQKAMDKIILGLEREGLTLKDAEMRMIAFHEAGHAVLAARLPHADRVHKVTIIPRGRAMGVTQQLPEGDRYVLHREEMMDRITVLLGGRAAEGLIFKTSTSGAENDLQQATQMARKMVVNWGMSPRLGHVAFGGERQHVFLGEEISERREYSETTAYLIDQEVKAIVDEAARRATRVLEETRDGLEQIAELLLDEEEIPGSKVVEIVGFERAEER
ncbi:MAG: ATP-dependent zinc metalloprotease FtsH [Candidatus Eisenbacteria bacterium]|nr:ATP-dependent zinc metalloprotease FtsH [Candidatus Eisenbacteria bacterium]